MQHSRRTRSPSPTSLRKHNAVGSAADREAWEQHSEDDEQALKLKLEILETKQKLRDIRKKQMKQDCEHKQSPRRTTELAPTQQSIESPVKKRRIETTAAQKSNHIEVPVSPNKRIQGRLDGLTSPARTRLGLHGTTRAQDVSLKRQRHATTVKPDIVKPVISRTADQAPHQSVQPVSSFSQRLAELKEAGKSKKARSDRLEALRHSTFAARANEQAPVSHTTPSHQHNTTSEPSAPRFRSPIRPQKPAVLPDSSVSAQSSKRRKNCKDPAFYDPFSELHLESRSTSHTEAAQAFAGSEIYTIPRLLKEVKAPTYESPDCESDFVVFGILAEKSQPFKQQPRHLVHDKNDRDDDAVSLSSKKAKFMVLRLCDLKWQLDCYLFGTAFDKYWKLTEGTVLAILNPGILLPRSNINSGRFSLKLASSDDCILEIGKARDIGTCVAIRKDNQACNSWTNKAKSTLCEFHLNLQVSHARKGRMEVNTMWRGEGKPKINLRKNNPNQTFHHEYGELWTPGGHATSTVSLLDGDETTAFNNLTKQEASRKRIAASQRERDLAQKLASTKGGVAGEYFRAAYDISPSAGGADAQGEVNFLKPTASELGLLGKRATSQRLSPAKDRKRHFGVGAISSAGTEAMGWGGAGKAGLLQPARTGLVGSPERGQTRLSANSAMQGAARERSTSPRKQARFHLANGIKTPGRESGGSDLVGSRYQKATDQDHEDNDGNDDDDLDIV